MLFLQDAYQARLEEVTSQAASTSGSQPPDVAHKIQLWREVSGGVTRGRCYGTADLSANIRDNAPTLTQQSSAPSQTSRYTAPDQEAARAREEVAKAREEAAKAREDAARAREESARVSQQLHEILARLTRVEQAPASAPAPPASAPAPPASAPAPPPSAPGPSRQGDDDYANEFDPNFTMLNSDDSLFR